MFDKLVINGSDTRNVHELKVDYYELFQFKLCSVR